MSEAEKTAQELMLALKDGQTQLFEAVKTRDAEIEELGKAREETGKLVQDLDALVKQISQDIVGEQEKMNERIIELEKEKNRLGFPEDTDLRDLGTVFTESDRYKEMREKNILRCDNVEVGSFHKKELTSAATSAGSLVEAQRIAGIWAPPDRALLLRDLMTVARTGSNALEFVRETGFFNFYTTLTADAAAAQKVVTLANTVGLYAGLTVTLLEAALTEEIVIDTVDSNTQITAVDNLANSYTAANTPTATSGFFGGTPEGQLKPEMNLEYTLISTSVRTLAHWIPVTRQILEDAAQLRQTINQRLIYGLKLSEEEQLLYGDGAGENLQGLLTMANRQQLSWSNTPSGSTQIDAFRRAINLAKVAQYPVSGAMLHDDDWMEIELLKGEDGHYIHAIVSDGIVDRLWRVPITASTAIRQGDVLLGALNMAATLWDREDATIAVSDSHEDFFATNKIAMRAEERLALAVYRPEGFVHLTLDNPPGA